jgi:hypothetical protein
MDFSRVELSDEDQAFQDELRAFLATLVTAEVIARDRQTGENFDEGVILRSTPSTARSSGTHTACRSSRS